MPFPLNHPATFAPDNAADQRTSQRVYRRPSWLTRVGRRLRRIFS